MSGYGDLLRTEREEAIAQMRAILDLATAEKRDLSNPEVKKLKTLDYDIGQLAEKLGLDRYMSLTFGPAALMKSLSKRPSEPIRTVFSMPATSRACATTWPPSAVKIGR